MEHKSEILINCSQVTHKDYGDAFEFVLNNENNNWNIVECVKIESLLHGVITPITNPINDLKGKLFELNHVRVNPNLDNTEIINKFTEKLSSIGVKVDNVPKQNLMKELYKPLGEISENIRFKVTENGEIVFLSTSFHPKLIVNQKNLADKSETTLTEPDPSPTSPKPRT